MKPAMNADKIETDLPQGAERNEIKIHGVILAAAGIQSASNHAWVPAFAGTTSDETADERR
jgi:hypothetical protein